MNSGEKERQTSFEIGTERMGKKKTTSKKGNVYAAGLHSQIKNISDQSGVEHTLRMRNV